MYQITYNLKNPAVNPRNYRLSNLYYKIIRKVNNGTINDQEQVKSLIEDFKTHQQLFTNGDLLEYQLYEPATDTKEEVPFYFVYQNASQKKLLLDSPVVCIDSTYSTNKV